MRLRFSFFIVLFVFGFISKAMSQSLIGSGDFDVSNLTGSFTGSIGECFVSELVNNENSTTEGFQQPSYGLFTQITFQTLAQISIKVSPNPVYSQMLVSLDVDNVSEFSYSLYDFNAKLIQTASIENRHTYIDFSNMCQTNYLLSVSQNYKSVFQAIIIKY